MQEDSLLINQASIDRGLYNGSKFTNELAIKEDNKEVSKLWRYNTW